MPSIANMGSSLDLPSIVSRYRMPSMANMQSIDGMARWPSMASVASSSASVLIKEKNPGEEIKAETMEENDMKEQQFELDAGLFAKGLFVDLVPSLVDFITDVLSAKHFIQGDFYLKISNRSDGFPNFWSGLYLADFSSKFVCM